MPITDYVQIYTMYNVTFYQVAEHHIHSCIRQLLRLNELTDTIDGNAETAKLGSKDFRIKSKGMSQKKVQKYKL